MSSPEYSSPAELEGLISELIDSLGELAGLTEEAIAVLRGLRQVVAVHGTAGLGYERLVAAEVFQSNSKGHLLDALHEIVKWDDSLDGALGGGS